MVEEVVWEILPSGTNRIPTPAALVKWSMLGEGSRPRPAAAGWFPEPHVVFDRATKIHPETWHVFAAPGRASSPNCTRVAGLEMLSGRCIVGRITPRVFTLIAGRFFEYVHYGLSETQSHHYKAGFMPRFAVYFVPKADDSMYEFGTQILGYDVRARRLVRMSQSLEQELGEIEDSWVDHARPFGMHVTICDALDCDFGTIPEVEARLLDLVNSFDPETEFRLRRCNEQPVVVWGEAGAYAIVLRYDSNLSLAMLHALLVGCINPLARGTGYLRDFIMGARTFDESRTRKLRMFSSHTVLDNWRPHFTLLDPFSGTNPEAMASAIARQTEAFQELKVDTVCLLVQEHDGANWFIYRELSRQGKNLGAQGAPSTNLARPRRI